MEVITQHLPAGSKHNSPKIIVIHAMASIIDGEKSDLSAWILLKQLGLSAHRLIQPVGPVIKCREDNEGAYHAKGYNTDSLGVEFLVAGIHTYETFLEAIKHEYLTDHQYSYGMETVRNWMEEFEISKTNVIFHSYLSPGRKFDPGQGFLDSGFMDEL